MNLPDLLNLAEIEAAAKTRLAPSTLSYYDGGANDERTVAANRASYARLSLLPRVMVDISEIDLTTTVLGTPLKLPIGIAPSALHGLAYPDAECAAASMGSLMTLSNSTIEEIGEAAPGRWWFQLYLYRDREVSRALVQRAEAAGAGALVPTVDAAHLGRRERLLRLPMVVPEHLALPNIGAQHPQPLQYFVSLLDTTLNWNDLAWLRGLTKLADYSQRYFDPRRRRPGRPVRLSRLGQQSRRAATRYGGDGPGNAARNQRGAGWKGRTLP